MRPNEPWFPALRSRLGVDGAEVRQERHAGRGVGPDQGLAGRVQVIIWRGRQLFSQLINVFTPRHGYQARMQISLQCWRNSSDGYF